MFKSITFGFLKMIWQLGFYANLAVLIVIWLLGFYVNLAVLIVVFDRGPWDLLYSLFPYALNYLCKVLTIICYEVLILMNCRGI